MNMPIFQNIEKGGYILVIADNPDIVIFATGSEVWVALEVADLLNDYSVKVVNMACWELFEEQDLNIKLRF